MNGTGLNGAGLNSAGLKGAAAAPVAEHADAVVIGSGFGGAVAACRLAQAGLSVILLERGNAYPPDSFPRTPAQMRRAFWDPAAGLYGMFDVWHFTGCDSVVSSGLGGGSLIYANVLLRKDEHWFVQDDPLPQGGFESWPVTRADLDPHYDEVERMLGATPYPLDAAPYAATPKTRAMQDAAAELGLPWQLPPLAVSFAPSPGSAPGPGSHEEQEVVPGGQHDAGRLRDDPGAAVIPAAQCPLGQPLTEQDLPADVGRDDAVAAPRRCEPVDTALDVAGQQHRRERVEVVFVREQEHGRDLLEPGAPAGGGREQLTGRQLEPGLPDLLPLLIQARPHQHVQAGGPQRPAQVDDPAVAAHQQRSGRSLMAAAAGTVTRRLSPGAQVTWR